MNKLLDYLSTSNFLYGFNEEELYFCRMSFRKKEVIYLPFKYKTKRIVYMNV